MRGAREHVEEPRGAQLVAARDAQPAQVAREGEDLVLSQEGRTLRVSRRTPPGTSDWTVVEEPHGKEWESKAKGFRQILFTVPASPSGVAFDVTFK